MKLWPEVIPALVKRSGEYATRGDIINDAQRMRGGKVTAAALDNALRRARQSDPDVPTLDGLLATERPKDVQAVPAEMLELHRAKRELGALRRKNRDLLAELELANERAAIVDAVGPPNPRPIERREKKSGLREATAVAMLSDLHLEEVVKPSSVNGLNEFNPTVAAARMAKLAEGIVWQIAHHGRSWSIRDAVIWLGGDIISNTIHDELLESNAMSPIEALIFAQDLLTGVIDRVLAECPNLDRIMIPTSCGNHGRNTKKPRISTYNENSLETLLYSALARHYANEPRVDFNISTGQHLYFDVYSMRVRATHGDAIKGGGGIGGPTMPILRAVHKWNSSVHADLTLLGHWHQWLTLPGVMVNNCLIGYSPYAIRIAAPFAEPGQGFFLIDSKRGVCQTTQIWVSDEPAGKIKVAS